MSSRNSPGRARVRSILGLALLGLVSIATAAAALLRQSVGWIP